MKYQKLILVGVLIAISLLMFNSQSITTTQLNISKGNYLIYQNGENYPLLGYNFDRGQLVDLKTQEIIDIFFYSQGWIRIHYSSNGDYLIVEQDDDFHIFSTDNYSLINTINRSSLQPYSDLAFVSDSIRLFNLIGDEVNNAEIEIIDIDIRTEENSTQTIAIDIDPTNYGLIGPSPDGSKIFLTDFRNELNLFELVGDTASLLWTVNDYFNQIRWSPSSDLVIMHEADRYIHSTISGYDISQQTNFTISLGDYLDDTVYRLIISISDESTITISRFIESSIVHPRVGYLMTEVDVTKETSNELLLHEVDDSLIGIDSHSGASSAVVNENTIYSKSKTGIQKYDLSPGTYSIVNTIAELFWVGSFMVIIYAGMTMLRQRERQNISFTSEASEQSLGKLMTWTPAHDNPLIHQAFLTLLLKNLILLVGFALEWIFPAVERSISGITTILFGLSIFIDIMTYLIISTNYTDRYTNIAGTKGYIHIISLIGILLTSLLILLAVFTAIAIDISVLIELFAIISLLFISTLGVWATKSREQSQTISRLEVTEISLITLNIVILGMVSLIGSSTTFDLLDDPSELIFVRLLLAIGFFILIDQWIVGVVGQYFTIDSVHYLHTLPPLYTISYLLIGILTNTSHLIEIVLIFIGSMSYYIVKLRGYWYNQQV